MNIFASRNVVLFSKSESIFVESFTCSFQGYWWKTMHVQKVLACFSAANKRFLVVIGIYIEKKLQKNENSFTVLLRTEYKQHCIMGHSGNGM